MAAGGGSSSKAAPGAGPDPAESPQRPQRGQEQVGMGGTAGVADGETDHGPGFQVPGRRLFAVT